ncbi:MAG TPA: NUDIX hydrolase [Candidatus Dormibacteraeota bacterium]|nr:NUDIX hydrolase [Candidatus Dormibacteraeota bacterium]
MIRPIAICVIRRRDEILVFESRDTVKNETFYRPLGGGINFGEHSADTIVREMLEEIGAQISTPRHLGMIESVFVLNGVPRHELVQVYEASLVDKSLYQAASLTVTEDDGTTHPALWKTVSDFRTGAAILYPEGLLALLD